MSSDDQALREQALQNVRAKSAYKMTLLTYAGLSIFLIAVYLFSDPGGYFWPIWPIIAFVVAAIVSGVRIYRPQNATKSQVDAEYERLKNEER